MTYLEARKEIAKWQNNRRWENATGYSSEFTVKAGRIWEHIVAFMEEKKLTDWKPALDKYEQLLDRIAYSED